MAHTEMELELLQALEKTFKTMLMAYDGHSALQFGDLQFLEMTINKYKTT